MVFIVETQIFLSFFCVLIMLFMKKSIMQKLLSLFLALGFFAVLCSILLIRIHINGPAEMDDPYFMITAIIVGLIGVIGLLGLWISHLILTFTRP